MLSIIPDNKGKDADGISSELKEIIYNPKTDSFGNAKPGGRLWPVAVNLFGSERPSIVTGNTLGGLRFLQNDNSAESFDDLILQVYPNPFTDQDLLKITTNLPMELQIYSAVGSQVMSSILIQAKALQTIDLSALSKGVYILKFRTGGEYVIRRIVKH